MTRNYRVGYQHDVKIRIGLHTGGAALGGDNYVGLDVHRASRISSIAHGGQALAPAATRFLGEAGLPDGVHFRDLGEAQLKDIDASDSACSRELRPSRVH